MTLISCKEKGNHPEITLVMAEVNPDNSVVGQMDLAFKNKVEELSKGKIKIDLHFLGTLGDEKVAMELLMKKNSPIQLVRGPANLSSFIKDGPIRSSLLSIPYTFKNDEHFWKFANSDLAYEILNEPYELGLGVKGLFYAQEGLRHFFSTQKIESAGDLKDKKMRVSGKILTALGNSFGSHNIEIKFTDLYAALQTGEVEVAEQPITNYLSNSFYKTAPYMILDGHMLGAVSVMINSDCWDSLSESQKDILDEAGKYASDYCRKTVEILTNDAMEILKNDGVIFTPVKNTEEWQAACSDMRKEAAKVDPILYKSILELGN
ncbi:MAG: TRAP transporter substrate-binding protein [Treponema sp.]|nr:TRAP transporter substrate-binding protein [Treponema sp.]